MDNPTPTRRRRFLGWLAAGAGTLTLSRTAQAQAQTDDADLFGTPKHKLVYQFNQADPDYMQHVLFSVGAMLRKYGDEISLVVTAFGPGIHILGKHPERPIPKLIRERTQSLALYGVHFHACENTMKTLGWDKADLLDFAVPVEAGAEDLMLLQEKGYSYVAW